MKFEVNGSGRVTRVAGSAEVGHSIMKGPKPPPFVDCGGYAIQDGAFVLVDESLLVAAMRSQKIDQVNSRRDAVFYSPMAFKTTELEFRGQKDFERLAPMKMAATDLIAAGNPNGILQIIMADDQIHDVTAQEFSDLWTAGVGRNSSASLNARSLKNSLLACETVAELNAIDLDAGWP